MTSPLVVNFFEEQVDSGPADPLRTAGRAFDHPTPEEPPRARGRAVLQYVVQSQLSEPENVINIDSVSAGTVGVVKTGSRSVWRS
jgi:hypothetical protein